MADPVVLKQNNVISSLQEKISEGSFNTYEIGPELRYIGALPTSNNNNFEEEMLLGEDKLIITQIKDEDDALYKYQDFKFKRPGDLKYYILKVKENLTKTRPVKFEVKKDEEDIGSLYLEYTDNISLVDSKVLIKKFSLYYCEENPDGDDIITLISERTVYQNPYDPVSRSILTEEEIESKLD